jgi:hypothetical protein
MLGTWNAIIETPFAKMKLMFTVEKNELYTSLLN